VETLSDGTKLGDPFKELQITLSSDNPNKGKFGCVRTITGSTCNYNEGSGNKSHAGIDITASVGTLVHALHGGSVFATNTDFDKQNIEFIDNENVDSKGKIRRPNKGFKGRYGCHYKKGSLGNYIIVKTTLQGEEGHYERKKLSTDGQLNAET